MCQRVRLVFFAVFCVKLVQSTLKHGQNVKKVLWTAVCYASFQCKNWLTTTEKRYKGQIEPISCMYNPSLGHGMHVSGWTGFSMELATFGVLIGGSLESLQKCWKVGSLQKHWKPPKPRKRRDDILRLHQGAAKRGWQQEFNHVVPQFWSLFGNFF